MNYFRQVLGSQQQGEAPSGTETIDRLCDRVKSSVLLDDRRDAVRALKSLSKKFRYEVGERAMDVLIHVLLTDSNDAEITGFALECLCTLVSNEPLDDEENMHDMNIAEISKSFAELFVSSTENVSLLLNLLDDYDFHVRWPVVKLLTTLLIHKGRDLQEIILVSPMGVSKLMDLLDDSREIIRNDGLLLLQHLTKSNSNIQKIVAFENAFERLLDIVRDEGNSDGGIVVEDCLLLILNLLKNNASNQNFFKEGSFVQRLPTYFELQSEDDNVQNLWSAQKVTNIHLMLQLIRTLVSPNNPQAQLLACQKAMYQCGVLRQLCEILMASGVPADVLTEAINTVSEIIRGNESNQEFFAGVMAPSNPPRPAIVVLLMSMVKDKQLFVLRCAVLYCFQSFLYKNDLGQSQIIQTLLPATTDVNTISAGQLLCGGLFSPDSLSTWFAAVALMHSINSNQVQQEQLLRVQLATSLGNPSVSLLQQCTNILGQNSVQLQTRIGILMLLSQWLHKCPIAVTQFLQNAANVPFLISQISASEGDELEIVPQGLCAFVLGICVLYNEDQVENYQKQNLRAIIEKRIGMESFADKLNQVSKHELYNKAAKQPQLNYRQAAEVLFDFEFTRLYRTIEPQVLKSLSPSNDDNDEDTKRKLASLAQHESIVMQYKELIREQDSQLNSVKGELTSLKALYAKSEQQIMELNEEVQQQKDQNALLKVQKGNILPLGSTEGTVSVAELQAEIELKKGEIHRQANIIEKMKNDLSSSQTNGDANEIPNETSNALLNIELQEVKTRLVDKVHVIEQKDEEIKLYKEKYEQSNKQVITLSEKLSNGETDSQSNAALLAERLSLSAQLIEKEQSFTGLKDELNDRDLSIKRLKGEKDELYSQVQKLEEQLKQINTDKDELEEEKHKTLEECEKFRKEQDDLLVLLADQDNKISDYKKRLQVHGEVFDDDSDDDLDIEDDGDNLDVSDD